MMVTCDPAFGGHIKTKFWGNIMEPLPVPHSPPYILHGGCCTPWMVSKGFCNGRQQFATFLFNLPRKPEPTGAATYSPFPPPAPFPSRKAVSFF